MSVHFEGRMRVWLERLTRAGLAMKGIVYLLVSGLSLLAAFGDPTLGDRPGAAPSVGDSRMGKMLLALTAAGLLGYAADRVLEALLDPEGKGSDADGIVKRVGYGATAGVYGALAALAIQMMGGGSGGGGTKSWLGALLEDTAGKTLVALVGFAVITAGLLELHRATGERLGDALDLGDMTGARRVLTIWGGRLGVAARGVVFPIIGAYLVKAAITADPEEARGLGGALAELASRPSGIALLTVVAVGLFAYGASMLALSRYLRIAVP